MERWHFDLGPGQLFREMFHDFFFPVDQKCSFRVAYLSMQGEEFSLVSVGGKSTDGKNFGTDRDFFVVETNGWGAVDNSPSQSAMSRIPDKDDTGLWPPDIMFEVMPYSPSCAHAGSGHNDRSTPEIVQGYGLGRFTGKMQAGQ